MKSIIKLHNITRVFQEEPGSKIIALQKINLEIFEGEFLVILGPSGSGKSTLLRIMSGLDKSYAGTLFFSKEVGIHDISFVFQQFALFPWLTVSKNIELGLIAKNISEKARQKIVSRELQQFGLKKFASAHPKQLSGGMKQRVGLARALATNPKIIFMDEPFSELDSFTAKELRKDLLSIWRERKSTIIMVTHLVEEALELADRIAVLTPRPGSIEAIVTNSLPRPRNKRSPEFYRLQDKLYHLVRP